MPHCRQMAVSLDGALTHMGLARFGSAGSPPACTEAPTGKSRLTLKIGDKTKWKWVGPTPLVKADFGTPTAGTDLTFCVVDQATGSPISVLTIAGTTAYCAKSSCWTETSKGFVGNRRWTGRLRMKALTPAAAPGRIVVTGRAAPAGTPDPPLATPLVARMTRGDGGGCWEATFSNPIRNGLTAGFVAYSD